MNDDLLIAPVRVKSTWIKYTDRAPLADEILEWFRSDWEGNKIGRLPDVFAPGEYIGDVFWRWYY